MTFSALVGFSGFTICIVVTGFGLLVLYLWTLFIIPTEIEVKTRQIGSEMNFSERILIRNSLKILVVFHTELCQMLVITCLHNFIAVVLSSGALYNILIAFVEGGPSAGIVIVISVILIISMTLVELFAIYFMSNAVTASKQFLHRMGYIYGNHKYESRVIKSLLPNSMNVEFVNSLKTLVNGIEMNYFLNYLQRVTDNALTLLLANK